MSTLQGPNQPGTAAVGVSADAFSAGGSFDLPQFAELTYQEYTFCAHGQALDDWLCATLGICGDNHA